MLSNGARASNRPEALIRKGKSPAKKQLKARILLAADECPAGPKGKMMHGSRLNMAELELGALASQCLGQRAAERQRLKSEIAAREAHRSTMAKQSNGSPETW